MQTKFPLMNDLKQSDILKLALPNIVTNITVPLLGMVDIAIVGHIGNETYIGAIAIGTMIFDMIYWNFGFLRMGTSGFTAKAYGANNMHEAVKILIRGVSLALIIAAILLVLQYPIAQLAKLFVKGSNEMISLALQYFYIRIWASPATLGLYAIKGWYIGMQNSKLPMWIAIVLNLLNIIFSLIFVFVFKMNIAGVAWGTVLAQYGGLTIAIVFLFTKYGYLRHFVDFKNSLRISDLKQFFKVNTDIFLRSLCMIAVFTFIPAISSTMGDRILAANTLLMQLFTLFSYMMDGFAYAGESLTGRFIGAKNLPLLKKSIKSLFYWGSGLTLTFTMLYIFWGRGILSILTNNKDVIDTAMNYITWTVLVPVCGFAAFLFDGIYVGATASKSMRNAIFVATAMFFTIYYSIRTIMGNNGLWIAFLVFLILRSLLMALTLKKDVINQL